MQVYIIPKVVRTQANPKPVGNTGLYASALSELNGEKQPYIGYCAKLPGRFEQESRANLSRIGTKNGSAVRTHIKIVEIPMG